MTALATSIADTVAGMRRVLSKEESSSDSDDPYLRPPRHSCERKRKQHPGSDGLVGRSSPPKRLKKAIKHAGFTRNIIFRNPQQFDDGGVEIPPDEEDIHAHLPSTEANPYSEIRLDHLLRPLTSVATLPEHESLSVVYQTSMLSDMVQHSCRILQKERKMLANAKRLLTRLRGDTIWAPSGNFADDLDSKIFDTAGLYNTVLASVSTRAYSPKARESSSNTPNDSSNALVEPLQEETNDKDGENPRPEPGHLKRTAGTNIKIKAERPDYQANRLSALNGGRGSPKTKETNALEDDLRGPSSNSRHDSRGGNSEVLGSVEDEHNDKQDALVSVNSHKPEPDDGNPRSPGRRVTRAQAQAEKDTHSSHSRSRDRANTPRLHPLFILAGSVKADEDLGLPPAEAQETRQLLVMYVQKQEEVCRNAERLYGNLLLADRQRHDVFKWCKAQGHVGEMSDGEDWYDKDEWGLEEDLRKGHAEDEDDIMVQGKKTRGRRA